jgi:hypothetical protein
MRVEGEEGGRGETLTTRLVIGTEDEAADVGHSGNRNLSLVPDIPVPDRVPLFRFQTGSGIAMSGCRTVRYSGNLKWHLKAGIEPRMSAGRCK